jgi:hypothetical protein
MGEVRVNEITHTHCNMKFASLPNYRSDPIEAKLPVLLLFPGMSGSGTSRLKACTT